MRITELLVVSTFIFSCSTKHVEESTRDSTKLVATDSTSAKVVSSNYLTSVYDNPEFSEVLVNHKKLLVELSDSSVFSTIHLRLLSKLDKQHQDYFSGNRQYQLLSFSKGNLFQNKQEDYVFVVYDDHDVRFYILVYDAMRHQYAKLFSEIKVVNGLESANCNYGGFGTLDYIIADELIYHKDYLIENPGTYLESSICRITTISNDDDFVLEDGCISGEISDASSVNSLCISTSSVYNNWECLTYNKESNLFVIFYGQAFAD